MFPSLFLSFPVHLELFGHLDYENVCTVSNYRMYTLVLIIQVVILGLIHLNFVDA